MSCERLSTSSRQAAEFDELSRTEREGALAHLVSCVPCRRATLASDPSLVFSLGSVGSTSEVGEEEGEVERMRVGVAALRRARGHRAGVSGLVAGLRSAAAAALLAVALVSSDGVGRAPARSPGGSAKLETGSATPFSLVAGTEPAGSSVLENLDRPLARVYQLTEEDLSLVMIVDETLDI